MPSPEAEQYKEIELSKFISSGQPFVIAFAFPKEGPIVIKGMETEVLDYLKSELSTCHFKLTKWNGGKKLESWDVNSDNWNIQMVQQGFKRQYQFMYGNDLIFTLKRVPKRFIRELEKAQQGAS